jgi:hypothetical protein
MAGIKIQALTEKGTKALDHCIQEDLINLNKKRLLERIAFRKIFKTTISRNPLTYTIIQNPDSFRFTTRQNFEQFSKEYALFLTQEDTQKDIDFFIEVTN